MTIRPEQVASWKAELGGDAEIAAVIDQALDPKAPWPGITTRLGGKLNERQRTRLAGILDQIRAAR
jgi:hypothetical protein